MVKDKPINLDEIAFSECCSKRKTKKNIAIIIKYTELTFKKKVYTENMSKTKNDEEIHSIF